MTEHREDTVGSSIKKYLGLATIRRSTDKERNDTKLHNEKAEPNVPRISVPLIGIEYFCRWCQKMTLATLYDPWSYNAHANCTHCYARADFMPNGINYGLSLAQLCILAEAARKRHSNWLRIKAAMLSYALFGIPADLIPADREGMTLGEVETRYFFALSHFIMSE